MIYLVKKPFTSLGKFYSVGSVIADPTEIKLFRTKVREKRILCIEDADIERYAQYFLEKFGVDIREAVATLKQAEEERLLKEAEEKAAAEEAERLRIEAEEKVKADLAARVEALKLDLPDDLTLEQVTQAVVEAEAKAAEAARLKVEADKKTTVATATVVK